MSGDFYAVKEGRQPGIYYSWEECKKQTDRYSGASFEKFNNIEEAKAFLKGKSRYSNSNSNILEVYVDGSYNPNKQFGGYGCVMVKENKIIDTVYNTIEVDKNDNTWNVAGELAGALAGIEWAIENDLKRVRICYDYLGIEKWADGSWATNKVITSQYALKVKKLSKLITIEFKKVKAHSGNTYNELADKLAKRAIEID